MVKNYTLWLTISFICSAILLSAQSTVSNKLNLSLEKEVERKSLEVAPGKNFVTLCGLVPGKFYGVTAVPDNTMPDATFKVKLSDASAEKTSFGMSAAERPQYRRFKAEAECVQLILEATRPGKSKIPMSLSIICQDCRDDNQFIDKFVKNLAEMAVISVNPGVSASSLVTNTLIGGNCFDVSNITSAGNTNSRGTFANGMSSINMNTGLVLCSGHVNILPGPNDQQNANNGFNQSGYDADLDAISTGSQWDISKLEFDFKPTANTVQFDFVFGSEEYCEYVGSGYNDAFGFFISGPGITGVQNLAVVPSTTNPIVINNINHLTNTAYYVNNNTWNPCQSQTAYAPNDIELDGYTTVLTATASVIPCSTYHIKLAICDIGDAAYASAVFLKANSFDAGGSVKAVPVVPGGSGNIVFEDCGVAYFKFTRNGGNINDPLTVTYTVTGTATEGGDYETIVHTITIPAGQTEIQIPINVFQDFMVEGDETIIITLDNPCSCTQNTSTLIIRDKPPLEIDLQDVELCGNGSATLSPTLIQPGQAPITYLWSNSAVTPSITVTGTGTQTYTVTATDHCGATSTASATVTWNPVPAASISGSGSLCAGGTGSFDITVNLQGEAPWTVTLSNGSEYTFNSSPGIITVTEPGTYTLTNVTSPNGCPGQVMGQVVITEYNVDLAITGTDPNCNGQNSGSVNITPSGGGTPYTYLWSNNAVTQNLTGVGAGTYSVVVTDSHGCTDDASITLTEPDPLTAEITPPAPLDCTNPTGTIDLTVSGGTPNYVYHWNNNSAVEDLNITTGGTYSVTVTDSHNCSATATVTVASNLNPPIAVALPPAQINCTNSTITLSGVGSSTGPNFTYEWTGPGFVCCETTLNPQVDQSGTYTLLVTNTDNSCTATVSVTVVQNNTPPVAVANAPFNISCAHPTVTLSGAGSSTGSGITYLWSASPGNITGGGTTLSPTVNQAGTYTITVTNGSNGCTNEATVTIEGDTQPPVVVIAPPLSIDCTTSEITLDASGSSQGPNFQYQWTGPGIVSGNDTPTPTVNQGGTYTLVITNTDNSCTATASVTVTQNTTLPTAVATTPGQINCTHPTLTLSGTGSSTGSQYTYEWTAASGNIVSGETTLNPVIDQAGTYTLVVTNTTNGCTKEVSVTVTENLELPTVDAGPDLLLNCLSPTQNLQGSGSGTGSLTYSWSAAPGNIVSGGTTATPLVNQAGTYTVTVTTANGCTATDEVTVTANFDTPDAQILPPPSLNCAFPELTLDGSGSTQGPNIEYLWTGPGIVSGETTTNPTIDAPGTYTLVVTNTESGCTDQASVTITQNITPPNAVATTPGNINCAHPTLVISGTGSSTGSTMVYQWSTSDGTIVSGETTLNPTISSGGTYTLVVTNISNGCTNEASVTVTEDNTPPTADAGPDLVLNCFDPTGNLQGGGSSGTGLTYQWTAAPGNIVSGANTASPLVNQAGTYTLVVTSSNGCTATDVVEVTTNFATPDAVIAPPGVINCNFPELTLDGSGSTQGPEIEYLWTGPGIVSGETTTNPTIDAPGTYTLVVTNTESGCTDQATVTITQNITPPNAVAATPGNIDCAHPTLVLSGSGSSIGATMTYLWTTLDGNLVSGETTLSPTINSGGTYTLLVTNTANGCTDEASVTVTENGNIPSADAGPDLVLNCYDPTQNLQGGGSSGTGLTYQWTASPGNIVSGANTATPLVNQAGVYTLVVTASNGCTSIDIVDVTANFDTPNAVIVPAAVLNCNFPELELDGSGSTQGPDIEYLWSGPGIVSGETTTNPTIDAPGTYTLVVTNTASGCTDLATVNVQSNFTPPIAVAATPGQIDCAHPTLVLSGAGSSTGNNMTYLWTTFDGNIVSGSTTLSPTINQGGTYNLLVTNTANGCTDEASVTVDADADIPQADAGGDEIINCYFPTATLQGQNSTGSSPLNFAWSASPGHIVSGANSANPVVDQPGIYTLVITSPNGCTSVDQVEVTKDTNHPTAAIAPADILNCFTPEIILDGTGSTQGANIEYEWNGPGIVGGGNTTSITVDAPGLYSLLVTNTENGCTASISTTVTANFQIPLANAGPAGQLDCTHPTYTISATASQGPNFTYQWDTPNGNILSGDNSLSPVVNQEGDYFLLVTNTSNGCTATDAVFVQADNNLPESDAGPDYQLDCANYFVFLDGTNSTFTGAVSFQWTASPGHIVSGANTLTPKVDQPGIYTLTVTSTANGCTSIDFVTVLDQIIYPTAIIDPPGQLNCTNSFLNINAVGNTSVGDIFYEWSTSNGNIVNGELTATPEVDAPGTYIVTVTDQGNYCTTTASIVVTENIVPPVAVTDPLEEITCQYPQIQISGVGSSVGAPFFYEWTTTTGNIVSGNLTLTPTVNQPGIYNLTVFNNDNGCTNTAQVVVSTNQTFPNAAAVSPGPLTCAIDSLTLSGTGSSQGTSYVYLWSTTNGNILSGATSLSPTVDAVGTYTLNVINTATGCTSTANVTVNSDFAAPNAQTAPGGQLSCTVHEIGLSGTGSSAGSNFTYNWETQNGSFVSGQNTLTPMVNATGDYTLVVTNLTNGCTASSTTTVTADAGLPNANAGTGGTLTCTVQQIQLNGSGSSSGSQFSYAWTGPGTILGNTTLTPTVSQPGNYQLLLTNTSNGCTAVSNVTVDQNIANPTAEAGLTLELNCTNTSLDLNGTGSSVGTDIVYNWSASAGGNIAAGGTTLTPTINQPGIYTLLVSDNNNGCTSSDQVTVTKNVTPPTVEAGTSSLIDCTHPTVSLSGSASGSSNLVYLWSTITGNIASGANTLTPVVDAPGTYILMVTNSDNGCTAQDNVVVNKDANVPIAQTAVPEMLTCAVNTVQLNAIGSSIGSNYTIAWTTVGGYFVSGQNSLQPIVNQAGAYTLTIVNTANNCEAQTTVNVELNNALPIANAGTPAIISCQNPILQLNGSGSSQGIQYTYNWNTLDGNIVSGANTISPTIDQSGFYNIVVTDTQNGCTSTSVVQILLDQNSPEADAGPDQTLDCLNSTLTLDGLGSSNNPTFSIQWTATGGGNIVSGANTLTPVIDQPGTYSLLVTNPANGCTSDETVTVDKDITPPTLAIGVPAMLNCAVTSTTLDGSGSSWGLGFQCAWNTADGHIVSGASTLTPVIDAPGTYNVLLTNSNNGCTSTNSVVVTENVNYPAVDAGPTDVLSCTHTTTTLQGSVSNIGTNYQINWSTSGGNIQSGQNSLSPVVSAAGSYLLTITNLDNQCEATDVVTITQDASLPIADANTAPDLTCALQSINLNGFGSSVGTEFSYLWTTTDGTIVSGANTLNPVVSEVGTYILTVYNTDNNCSANSAVTVGQNTTPPLANAGAPVTLTCTDISVGLDGSGSAQGSQYSYFWSTTNGILVGGINTLTPTAGAPGLYTIQVTNNLNGCTSTSDVNVIQDLNAPIAAATAPNELTCLTNTITLNTTGTSQGNQFVLNWSTVDGNILSGADPYAPVVDAAGVYELEVVDFNNGCKTITTVEVTENRVLPTVDAGQNGLITCDVLQNTLTASASGGTAGISYTWTTSGGNIVSGGNSPNPVIDAGGQYVLTVTDLYNGCTASDFIDVSVNQVLPTIAIASPAVLTCAVQTVTLSGNGSSQGPQFEYQWSGNGVSGTTLTQAVATPGTYTLLVTNNSTGCTSEQSVPVTQDIVHPIVDAGTGFELTCSVLEDNLNGTAPSGAIYTYQWTTLDGNIISGTNTLAPIVDADGTYNLLVTNTQNGCTSTDNVVVTLNADLPTGLILDNQLPQCGGQPGSINITAVDGGTGPYLYSINNGDDFYSSELFSNLTPGTYDLIIKDVNGCTFTESVTFPVPVEPDVNTTPEITLDFGEESTLVATINVPLSQIDTIIWSPMEGLTPTNKPNEMMVTGFNQALYTVTVINNQGCEDRSEVLVHVGKPAIWAPNAISSNVDENFNDAFLIFSKENTIEVIHKLQVFDRWGNEVFSTREIQPNDPNVGWNGTFRGKKMDPAVFVWYAEIELTNGRTILMKGDVTIVN